MDSPERIDIEDNNNNTQQQEQQQEQQQQSQAEFFIVPPQEEEDNDNGDVGGDEEEFEENDEEESDDDIQQLEFGHANVGTTITQDGSSSSASAAAASAAATTTTTEETTLEERKKIKRDLVASISEETKLRVGLEYKMSKARISPSDAFQIEETQIRKHAKASNEYQEIFDVMEKLVISKLFKKNSNNDNDNNNDNASAATATSSETTNSEQQQQQQQVEDIELPVDCQPTSLITVDNYCFEDLDNDAVIDRYLSTLLQGMGDHVGPVLQDVERSDQIYVTSGFGREQMKIAFTRAMDFAIQMKSPAERHNQACRLDKIVRFVQVFIRSRFLEPDFCRLFIGAPNYLTVLRYIREYMLNGGMAMLSVVKVAKNSYKNNIDNNTNTDANINTTNTNNNTGTDDTIEQNSSSENNNINHDDDDGNDSNNNPKTKPPLAFASIFCSIKWCSNANREKYQTQEQQLLREGSHPVDYFTSFRNTRLLPLLPAEETFTEEQKQQLKNKKKNIEGSEQVDGAAQEKKKRIRSSGSRSHFLKLPGFGNKISPVAVSASGAGPRFGGGRKHNRGKQHNQQHNQQQQQQHQYNIPPPPGYQYTQQHQHQHQHYHHIHHHHHHHHHAQQGISVAVGAPILQIPHHQHHHHHHHQQQQQGVGKPDSRRNRRTQKHRDSQQQQKQQQQQQNESGQRRGRGEEHHYSNQNYHHHHHQHHHINSILGQQGVGNSAAAVASASVVGAPLSVAVGRSIPPHHHHARHQHHAQHHHQHQHHAHHHHAQHQHHDAQHHHHQLPQFQPQPQQQQQGRRISRKPNNGYMAPDAASNNNNTFNYQQQQQQAPPPQQQNVLLPQFQPSGFNYL